MLPEDQHLPYYKETGKMNDKDKLAEEAIRKAKEDAERRRREAENDSMNAMLAAAACVV